jgi:tetratricopeptide (TPR) repeat protein
MNPDFLDGIELLIGSGRPEQAEAQTREAAATHPDSMVVTLAQAILKIHSYRYDEALALAETAERHARRNNDVLVASWAARIRSVCLRWLDRYEEALEAAEGALALGRQAQNKLAEAYALRSKARALRRLERLGEALEAGDVALGAARETQDKRGEADALDGQSSVLRRLDRYDQAIEAAEAAVEAARQGYDKLAEAYALDNKSEVLAQVGRYEEALDAAGAAVAAAREANDKAAEANALDSQAEALRKLDRPHEAIEAADAAVVAAREARARLAEVRALVSKSHALASLRRDEEALEAATRALEVAHRVGNPAAQAIAIAQALRAHERLGQWSEAVAVGRQVTTQLQQADEACTAEADCLQSRTCAMPAFDVQAAYDRAQDSETQRREWITAARQAPDLPHGADGVLVVLKGYASYGALGAAVPQRLAGGGYVVWWRERGLVIDPGLGFINAMRHHGGFSPANIDAIVVTHDHPDHVGDLLPLLSVLHEAREAQDRKPPVSLYLNPSSQALCRLAGSFGTTTFRCYDLTSGGAIELAWARLVPFDTCHRDLSGFANACRGLRLELLGDEGRVVSTIGLTSDTGWFDELPEKLLGPQEAAQLVLAHVGDIYPEDTDPDNGYAPYHLGVKGLGTLIWRVAKSRGDRPWNCLVSEWGPAMQGMEGLVASGFERQARPAGTVAPAVMGLEVALPAAWPMCQHCHTRMAERWVEVPLSSMSAPHLGTSARARRLLPGQQNLTICMFTCAEHDHAIGADGPSTFSAPLSSPSAPLSVPVLPGDR